LEHDIDTVGTLANLKETADQYLLQHSHEGGFIKPDRKGWKKAAKILDGNSSVRVSTRRKKTSVRLKDQALSASFGILGELSSLDFLCFSCFSSLLAVLGRFVSFCWICFFLFLLLILFV
jgi:hypothetical protein